MSDLYPVKMRPNKSPQRVRFGYPWIYSDELVLDRRTKKIAPGSLVQVIDAKGEPLAICAFNALSKITCRVLGPVPAEGLTADWFAQKLRRAADLRDRLYAKPFYRLIHAEADGLPGLVIDRFADAFVIQPNAAWVDARLDLIEQALVSEFGANLIFKNASGRTRALEGLDTDSRFLLGQSGAPIPVEMNTATYFADLSGGQKTGIFFDQRDNHAFASKLADGADVLDVFSHVGGFALAALAGGAKTALAVDASQAALTLARQGAEQSGFQTRFDTRQGDAFDVLADLDTTDRTFDLVVCDPPAFAPSKSALDAGLRAYERVARLSASLVRPGGYLVLCSCSHAADLAKFRQASLRGIGRAGRAAQIIHTGTAGADHPVHPHLAESAYLKSLFLRLD